MKKIFVIHTGGTIAMHQTEDGAINRTEHHPLSTLEKILNNHASINSEEIFQLPSPHITPQHMLVLAKRINELQNNPQCTGIVVTHGTDTLEETAYALQLLFQGDKPVVITGAMRSSDALSADGPGNLLQAVRLACHPEAHGKGILIVFNDEIHSARFVEKTHTTSLQAFKSPAVGALGYISKESIHFYRQDRWKEPTFSLEEITKRVGLIKAFAGMDAEWLTGLQSTNIDGLVIEALGQGNLPPQTVPVLQKIIATGKPIVIVSRCPNGWVEASYGYEGGGKQLATLGLIFASDLSGPKARLKLLFALEAGYTQAQIGHLFTLPSA